MLSIEASRNAEQAKRYFRESLAVEDYYSEKAEIPGKWHGRTAAMLGLSGEVKKSDFERLIDNINPNTNQRLTPRNSPNRRPLYDCTFSAPKSVSILLALTGDHEILQIHNRAVRRAMAALEADIQTQSGQGKQKHYPTTGNLIWAEFIHQTTRPLESEKTNGKKEFVPDMQLHTHATVLNATWFDKEDRFRAVEFGSVKKLAPYYEALYHGELGLGMREIGYEIKGTGKRWEVNEITKAIRDKFSRRTLEIEELARARGIKSARSKSQLGRLTRKEKHKSVEDSVLPEIWRKRLSPIELEVVENLKRNNPTSGDKGRENLTAQKAVDLALSHYFERQSGVPEKRVLGFAIDLTSGIIPPNEIHQELKNRDDIVDVTEGSIKHITTKDVIREEDYLVERVMSNLGKSLPLKEDHEITNSLLNEGQSEAVQHVLKSRNKIVMISGDAGTGKTTLAVELSKAIKSVGKQMYAFATSADASRGELRDRGFDNAETIAKLLSSPELKSKLRGNVMLIDEAGMIGTPTMHQLLDIAEKEKVSKIVLSGDWKQHPSIERGDAMMHMEQAGLPVTRVEEIVRQRNNPAYKQVVEKVAKGIGLGKSEHREIEVKEAFDQMDKQGLIVEEENLGQRHDLIAEDYVQASAKSPDDVIVVAPTHGEGRDVTKAIRTKLKEQDRLGQEDKLFDHLVNQQLTDTERQIFSNYEEGQIVEFHQNVRGFKAGTKLKIEGFDKDNNVLVRGNEHIHPVPLPLEKAEHFQLFNKQTIPLAQEDRIRITKNIKSIEGTHLNNGKVYDAKGFTQDGHIELSNGKTLHKDAGHFNYGTYRTSHSAQSKNSETVLLCQSSKSFAAGNDKQFYVSISRGTDNLKVYTDNKQSLREVVARSGDRISAKEIEQKAERQKQAMQLQRDREEQQHRIKAFYQERTAAASEKLKSIYDRQELRTSLEGGEPDKA
ncbi:MobF family relaxase [Ekhidna sp.]|jgi:conjugative relaxase-like TrwC/TraI family protein|uniref:MobF family relaxase n=1 Tax=Ekhidna sp. TaxID=2608089 RepID=UPI0032EC7F8F|tara:strand:+ start:2281 stop:5121 length:2841 start_codon:yes stop_codon:yes gene_type:complete